MNRHIICRNEYAFHRILKSGFDCQAIYDSTFVPTVYSMLIWCNWVFTGRFLFVKSLDSVQVIRDVSVYRCKVLPVCHRPDEVQDN